MTSAERIADLQRRVIENFSSCLKEPPPIKKRRELYCEIAHVVERLVGMISGAEFRIKEQTLMHEFLTEHGLTALAARFEPHPDALDEVIELFPQKRIDFDDFFGGKQEFIEEEGYGSEFRYPVALNNLLLMRDLGFYPQEELEAGAKLFIVDFLHSGEGAIVAGEISEEQMREIDQIPSIIVNDKSWGFQPGDLEEIAQAVIEREVEVARLTRLKPGIIKEHLRRIALLVDLDKIDTMGLEEFDF